MRWDEDVTREVDAALEEVKQHDVVPRGVEPTASAAAPVPGRGEGEGGESKRSVAAVLVDLALERYTFGCSPDGEAFAVSLPDGHVVRMLKGGQVSLRSELASAYRRSTGKVAGQQALADAMLVLAGMAEEAEPDPIALRVAEHGRSVWVDLGDRAERAVAISATGWQLSTTAPVKFRRTKLTGALPEPVAGGSIEELWGLVNITPADRPLVLAWLVAALVRPDIPHPVLALFGEQGTGKSSASKLLAALVDPSPVQLRKPPKDAEGWVTAASGSWVVGLDNLSSVTPWFSDSLCRAVTGDGDVRRALYTDGDVAVFGFRRVILLNGIDVGAMAGDLADRAIVVNLDQIPEDSRRTETELSSAWEEAHPRILGALLTECSECLSRLPSVRLGRKPRMADFAEVLAALDERHGTAGLGLYADQSRTMAEDTLDAEPFLARLRDSLDHEFTGTAAELRTLLTLDPTPRGWPTARGVTTLLKRNAPGLRKAGWIAEDAGRDPEARSRRWRLRPPEIARERHSERSDARPPLPEPSEPSEASGVSPRSQDTIARRLAAETAADPNRCSAGYHRTQHPLLCDCCEVGS